MSQKDLVKVSAFQVAETERAKLDDVVEQTVVRLNRICKMATLEFALTVGQIVIEHFYLGDLARWRDRDPQKDTSLRKLARHPMLPMSAAALYRSVAIYELCERLQIRTWRHISTGHMRLVLPLSAIEQERLLRAAEAGGWPVRRLDEEVAGIAHVESATRRDRGGRRRISGLQRAMKPVQMCVRAVDELLKEESDILEERSPESTRDAI